MQDSGWIRKVCGGKIPLWMSLLMAESEKKVQIVKGMSSIAYKKEEHWREMSVKAKW